MSPTLIVDTREQKPYRFPGVSDVEKATLPVGDYTYKGYEDTFAVERKSLDDLAMSVGTDRTRFENEIRRANGYANQNEDGNSLPGTKPDKPLEQFVVVIEAHPKQVQDYSAMLERNDWTIREAKNKALNGEFRAPYLSATHPNSILGTVKSWPSKYSTMDFTWCGSRRGAKDETLALLDQWYLKHQTGGD